MPISSLIAYTNGIQGMPTPEVGMGATQILCADQYPYTITKVLNEKTIEVKSCAYKADPSKNNTMGHQNWIIDPTPDENATTIVLTLRKNGWWIPKGESMKEGTRFVVGQRRHYYSWEF